MQDNIMWIEKEKDIPWNKVIGFDLVKLDKPWYDEDGDKFPYAMAIYTRDKKTYYCNHYMDNGKFSRQDVGVYFHQLAERWLIDG